MAYKGQRARSVGGLGWEERRAVLDALRLANQQSRALASDQRIDARAADVGLGDATMGTRTDGGFTMRMGT